MPKSEYLTTIYESPIAKDLFFIWYFNGSTSGLSSLEQAKSKFESLEPEKQLELREEYNRLTELISKGSSYYSGPFEG